MNIQNKIKAAMRKNIPELKAVLSGEMPGFVYGREIQKGTIPVFVFHEVTSDAFEEKLQYLVENQYVTIDTSELLDCMHSPQDHSKSVMITFDDGHISLWDAAYPLLKKYNFKAVSFICPGLVPDEEDPKGEKRNRILCNWHEIKSMHDSGHVDFQSHSMYHDLVFTSSKLIDFYHPKFSSHYLGKRDRAVVLQDEGGFSITNLWPDEQKSSAQFFGMPIFEHAPRYAVNQRLVPQPSLAMQMCEFVQKRGGTSFFETKDWRLVLRKFFLSCYEERTNRLIEGQDYQKEIAKNLRTSKKIIEEKLYGKQVDHVCYPWFESTSLSLETASQTGFSVVFLGVDAEMPRADARQLGHIKTLQRCPSKWIPLLPGRGRRTLFSIARS